MSFSDLESGKSPLSRNDDTELSIRQSEHARQVESIKSSVFAISANVASMQRMVQLLGTDKDSMNMREKLENITHSTQALIKKITTDLKNLSSIAAQSPQQKLIQQKISKDFQSILSRFQQVQRVAAEKSRETIARARAQTINLDENVNEVSVGEGPDSELQSILQRQQLQKQQEMDRLDQEIEYNESLIAEREQSIIEVEQSIYEVNEIFRDLGTLVNDQQGLVDNIESNIEQAATRTGDAVFELERAERHQKKTRRRMCCIAIIFIILLLILILVIVLR